MVDTGWRRTGRLAAALALVLCFGMAGAREARAEGQDGPERVGPFTLTSADGKHRVSLGFVGQLRFELTNRGGAFGASGGRSTEHAIVLRRVRSLLGASLLEGRLNLGFQLSTAPGSVELMDLWADYRFLPGLRLRLGQFKTPFGRYRWVSFTRLVLVDWPIAAQRFGSERQIGVMLHDGQKDDTPWSWAAGVFAGYGARASFATGLARSYAEPLPNPSNLLDPAAPGAIHPEIFVRLAHNAEGIDAETNSDLRASGFRHSVGLSVAYDFQPVVARDFSLRISPELLLKIHGVSLNLVGYFGFFEKSDGGDFAFGAWGLTGEAAWRFARHFEVSLRGSFVDLLDELRDDARLRAATRLAAATGETRAALEKQYASAGVADTSLEVAVGFNVYLVGHSLKWQTDVAWLRSDSPYETTDAIRVRTQAILAF